MKNIAVYIAVAIALIVVIVFFVYLPESMETKDEAKTAQEEAVVNNQVTLPGVDIAPGTRVVENGIPVTVVYLTNNGFSPQEVTITSGEEVRFINLTNASMRVGSRSELSSQFPIEYNKDKLADEIELIQKSSTPILGICYGCELIAVAFGGTLADRGEGSQLRENVCVKTDIADSLFMGREEFLVYDAHRWSIDVVPESLSVLASSEHGPEVIKHKTRPVYGFQFHPEKMLDETFGDELFNSFLKIEIGAR